MEKQDLPAPKAVSANEMIVGVVSWVYWNGDMQGGGGFHWFPRLGDAGKFFDEESKAWGDTKARVRLLWLVIPNSLNTEDGDEEVTDYLEEYLDEIETSLPVIEEVRTK